MTWEEDLHTDDFVELVDEDGVVVGSIEQIGGSWKCIYGTGIIAVRPDKNTAMICLQRYHEEKLKS
jgi:hypothetical protein